MYKGMSKDYKTSLCDLDYKTTLCNVLWTSLPFLVRCQYDTPQTMYGKDTEGGE